MHNESNSCTTTIGIKLMPVLINRENCDVNDPD